MRKYIKFWVIAWVVITIIIDIALFEYLSANCESIFLCNRSFEKIYPCTTSNYVVAAIEDTLNNDRLMTSTTKATTNDVDKEPRLYPNKKIGNDLTTTGEVIGKVDLVIAGLAVVLFFVVSSMVNRKPVMSAKIASAEL